MAPSFIQLEGMDVDQENPELVAFRERVADRSQPEPTPNGGVGGGRTGAAVGVGMGLGSSNPELEGRLVEAAVVLGRGWKPQPNLYRWELGSHRNHRWELNHRWEGGFSHPSSGRAPSAPTVEFPPSSPTEGNFPNGPIQPLPTLDADQ